MSFKYYNPNPYGLQVGDCVIRALTKFLNKDWDSIYAAIVLDGFIRKDMPSGNMTWSRYLKRLGYTRRFILDTCPDCYTVKDFCIDHPIGRYLLVLDQHVVTVVDGDYYDIWDSGNEIPDYYWTKA